MLKVFSVYDSKAEAFLLPFFTSNAAVAIRNFSSAASDAATAFSRHPGDYTLFEIGSWDESEGAWRPLSAKVALGSAIELRSEESS